MTNSKATSNLLKKLKSMRMKKINKVDKLFFSLLFLIISSLYYCKTKKVMSKIVLHPISLVVMILLLIKIGRNNLITGILFIIPLIIILHQAKNIKQQEHMTSENTSSQNTSSQNDAANDLLNLKKDYINNMDKLAWKVLQKDGPGGIVHIVKGFYSSCPNIFIVLNIDKGKFKFGYGNGEKPDNDKPFTFEELKNALQDNCKNNKRFQDLENYLNSFAPKLEQAIKNQEQAKQNTMDEIEKHNANL